MFCQDVPQLEEVERLQRLLGLQVGPNKRFQPPSKRNMPPLQAQLAVLSPCHWPPNRLPSATWPLHWPPNWLPSATWPPNSPPSATWTRFGRPTWLLNCQTAVQKLWQVAPSADVCILFLSPTLPFPKNARPTKNTGKSQVFTGFLHFRVCAQAAAVLQELIENILHHT